MYKPKFQPPQLDRPTPEELEKVLGFERQYINVIAGKLHKIWPDLWCKPPVDAGNFYAWLLDTIADFDRYSVLRRMLDDIARQKGGNWRKVQISQRIFERMLDLFGKTDPEGFQIATRDVHDLQGSEVVGWMSEHLGHPEYAMHRKVLTWLIAIEATGNSDPHSMEEEPHEKDPGAFDEDVSVNLNFQWDKIIEEIKLVFSDRDANRFSRDLIQRLADSLQRLQQLAAAYEENQVLAETALLDRLNRAIDDSESFLDKNLAGQQVLISLSECPKEARFSRWLRAHVSTLDTIDNLLARLHDAEKRYDDIGRLTKQAVDENDDEALANHSRARKEQGGVIAAAKDDLVAALRELIPEAETDVRTTPTSPAQPFPPPMDTAPSGVSNGEPSQVHPEVGQGENRPLTPPPAEPPSKLTESAGADQPAITDDHQLPEIADTSPAPEPLGVPIDDRDQQSDPITVIEPLPTPIDVITTDEKTEEPDVQPEEEGNPQRPTQTESPATATNADDYPADIGTAQLVGSIREEGGSTDRGANALVWALIRDGRVDLAYHIVRALEARGTWELAPLDANCLLALFLARQIHGPTDDVAEPVRELMGSLLSIDFSSRPVRHRRAIGLLVYAAALRPALLAPNLTSARAVLKERHLPLESTSLEELRVAIIDSDRLGLTLSEATLKGQAGPGIWERQLVELQQRCATWWSEYRHRHIKYAPTAKVWQRWLEDNGPIGTLLQAVVENRRGSIDQVRQQIATWRDGKTVSRCLDQTDSEIRGRNAALRPIDGGPRSDVVRLAAESMTFVQQWLSLHATRPTDTQGGDSAELAEWIRRTRSLLDKAREELVTSLEKAINLADRAATSAAIAALGDLCDLLDPKAPIRRDDLPWWKQLAEPLVMAPDIPLDEQWRPTQPYAEAVLFRRLLELATLTRNPDTWVVAFEAAERNCAHAATERILDVLRSRESLPNDFDTLKQRREDGLETCQGRLRKRVQEIGSAVAHAIDFGYLEDEEERSEIGEVLENCKERRRGDIGAALQELDCIEERLHAHKRRRIDEERKRLDQNPILIDNPKLHARIEHLLEEGAITTAAEYVTHAENGREPPSDEQSDAFADDFFPSFVSAVSERLSRIRGGEVLRTLESGCAIDPLKLPAEDPTGGLDLVRAWLALQGRRGATRDLARDLISALGFVVVGLNLEEGEQSGQTLLRLDTEPLQDRSICIVPQYGSLAHGRYRVACVWDRMPAEELRRHLGRRGGTPILLLYLNRMAEGERRALALDCRKNRQTFLVLDEWLLYFLATRDKASRLSALFQCTFPFTVANPYTPTSSDVPDELFFGRRRAMEQIADLHGTNLVFGGRQLGKTALLREVKRRYQTPRRGQYVVWIDIKAAGIGLGRPLDEVWAVIGNELASEGLLPNRVSRAETVQKEILSWLDADENRRLLVLLDEADELFAQDAESGYKTLMGLKNLMERTKRRFKVVFAGLHNVQRMSRDVNSPVKHLSQPVCVGPLLEDGEAREAFRLVSLPLRTLGYRLTDDVVNTILSHTNYYPNLIQHFCHSLLEYLNDHNQVRFDPGTTPPYEITAEHVEQAYQRRELRQFIRDRFQITLDLDPRYRVITLRIALETLERRKNDQETASGFAVEWIREQVLGLWPIGFKDRTTEAFRTLLDEMIGLGILRHAQRGYALRSPNIVNLLGAHEAIQQDLLDACDKSPPPIYTAATYRRALGEDQWQRSPLVAEQEYQILAPETGITVLFGAALSGISRVVQAIERASGGIPEANLHRLGDARDHNDFDKQLRTLLDRQKPDTNLVMLVGPDCAWNDAWLRCAEQALSHKRSKKTTARAIFIGDAASAWRWAGLPVVQHDAKSPMIMTLKPWAHETLRQWQRDTGIGPINEADLRNIADATGLWDHLMFKLGERIRNEPNDWRRILAETAPSFQDARDVLRGDLAQVNRAQDALKVLADFGEAITCEDLTGELVDPLSPVEARQILFWADLLGFVLPEGEGKWRLNPFLARLMADRGA